MKPLWILLALFLTGCASGQGRPNLPYDAWGISMLAPNYMEVWVESVDVIDQRGLVFERVHGGGVAMRSPANNKGNPTGWTTKPGGSSKDISGVDLPEFIFVRWQSLVEPQAMKPLWILIALTLTGCANGQGRPDLPFSSWNIGLGAPSHMEVWVESVDVIDRRGLVFERVHGGTVSYTGNPVGWPKRVGGGGGKSISGVDLPEFIFVRWQSLVEPQTYNVRFNIPLWVREEMLKPREVADCSRKEPRPTKIAYLDTFDILLAPGGIAKVWLTGGCLKSIELGRFEGKISKDGPDMGNNNGQYAYPPSPEAEAYIKKFGIPYGSW